MILGFRWQDLAKIGFVLFMLLNVVPILSWLERKISAFIQSRIGPNRTALFGRLRFAGFFQPLADAIKFIFKEDIVPLTADRLLYHLAPTLVLIPPMVAFTVIPFGNRWGEERLIVAQLPIGILLLMSVLSIGVYGIAFGGWASNSKYSLLGGLRSSAQMISYELTLGLSIVTALMFSGTVDPVAIVEKQAHGILQWNIFGGGNLLLLPFGLCAAFLFYTAALAENNRLPFDLPECESELVAGYHTEFSSMKFAMFMMAEYVAMITMSGLFVTLWLGGWSLPGIVDPEGKHWFDAVLSHVVFGGKVMALLLLYMWIRWTLPRFRYDQLMHLGWKVLVPIALINLTAVAVLGVLIP